MGLETEGYTKAKYNGKTYNIYSEPNYNDNTIELIDNDGCIFEVNLCDILLERGTKR